MERRSDGNDRPNEPDEGEPFLLAADNFATEDLVAETSPSSKNRMGDTTIVPITDIGDPKNSCTSKFSSRPATPYLPKMMEMANSQARTHMRLDKPRVC